MQQSNFFLLGRNACVLDDAVLIRNLPAINEPSFGRNDTSQMYDLTESYYRSLSDSLCSYGRFGGNPYTDRKFWLLLKTRGMDDSPETSVISLPLCMFVWGF